MRDPDKKPELPSRTPEILWEVMGQLGSNTEQMILRIARYSSQETKFLFISHHVHA